MMPSQNDFGSVLLNTTSTTASFTVTNTGEATSGAITPVTTGTNATEFVATNGCTTLAGGGTCVITVVFRPTDVGARTASLVVSGSPGGTVMAALIGTGNKPGTIVLNAPQQLSFGSVTVGSLGTQQTFTFQNNGTVATSAITTTAAGSDPGEFTKVSDNCNGQTLAPNATCTIVVNFRPNTPGQKNASFVVSATTGGTANGAVSGNGVSQAQLSLNPSLQDFGTIAVGSSSANVTFTVTNVGGVTSSALGRAVTGDYSIVNDNCNGMTLAPLGTCNVIVRFTPTTIGARSGALNITATTGGNPTATLTGVGITTGTLIISDSPFVFPNTTTGQTSTSKLFTITNTGGSATGAIGTALGGTDPSQFTIVTGSNGCQGVVLAASATCTIAVVFNPATGGTKSANLTVTASPGGTAVANISGNGIAPAQFDFDIDSRDYGSVVTGQLSAIQTFRITNVGGQTSGTPAVALNGTNASEFTITSQNCTAALTAAPAAGSFCDISVQFRPVTVGTKAATLDVLGTPGGPVHADLSGAGVAQAALSVNPSILTFPLTLIGDTSAPPQLFTVTNQGSVTTGTLAVTIIGTNPGDFNQTNNCEDGAGPGVDTLIAGGQCTVSVTFSPTARGSRTAQVQVTGTPGGTVTTALNGTSLPRLEILSPATNPFAFPGTSPVDPDAPLQVVVTLRNNTNAAHAIAPVDTFTGGHFTTTNNACTGSIGAGATCTYTVDFTPKLVGAQSGSTLFTLAGFASLNTATQGYTGTGSVLTLDISDDLATPTMHDFLNQPVNTSSATRVFTVKNIGMMTTGVLTVDLTGSGYQITSNTCSGVTLTNNATCTIGVVFTPTMTGAAPGTITVRATQAAPVLGGSVSATLAGNGTAAVPFITPPFVNYGTVFAGEPNPAITVADIAATNYNDITTSVGGSLAGPIFIVQNCSGTLAPLSACAAKIGLNTTLSPGPGPRTGNIHWTSSVGNVQQDQPFSAVIRSTLSITNPPGVFSTVAGTAPVDTTVDIHNDTTNQTLSNFSIGVGAAPWFVLNSANCTTLAPGVTCTITVRFNPGVAGSFPSALTVTADRAGFGPTGQASAPLVGTSITVTNLTVNEASFEFGSELQNNNGLSRTFTYTNIGGQTSGNVTPTLVGANPTSWSITASTCGVALATGATCNVTVRFNPTGTSVQTATLSTTSSPGNTVTTALSGNGIAVGGVLVTPTFKVFGDTQVNNNSAFQDFTVQNTSGAGTANLNITVTPEFGLGVSATTPCGATLAAGASCIVRARFEPNGTAGVKTGFLNIVSGGAYAALQGRALSSSALAASPVGPLTFTPTALTFTSASQVITVTNSGEVAATGALTVTPGGPDLTHFMVTTSTCSGATLAAGASCTITVAFKPTTTGTKNANVTITGAGLVPSPTVVSFSGTAVDQAALAISPSVNTDDGSRVIGVLDTVSTTFTISNNAGSATTGPLSFSLNNTQDFAIAGGNCVNGTTTLTAGSSCTIDVRFNPTRLGVRNVTLQVMGAPGGTVASTMTGTGLDALARDVGQAATEAFGAFNIGTAGTFRDIAFVNNSSVPTSFIQTVLTNSTGSDFSIVSDDCGGLTVAAGDTCSIRVRFVPSGTPGARTGNVQVSTVVTGTTTTASVAFTATANPAP